MADYPVLGQRTLIGLETLAAPGTAPVDANFRKLNSLDFQLSPNLPTEQFRPLGAKVDSGSTLTDDSTTFRLSGQANFNELQIPLSMILVGDDGTNTGVALAPTDGTPTTAKVWEFKPKPGAADTRRSVSMEKSSKAFGQRTTYGSLASFSLQAQRPGKVDVSGDGIARRLRITNDGLSPAFTPIQTDPTTIAAQVPIVTTCFTVYVSTVSRADLDSVQPFTRVPSLNYAIRDRTSPFYELNCAEESWAAATEGFAGESGFSVGAHADAMALFNALRQGQKIWVRYKAQGPVIGAGPDRYLLQLDTCLFIKGVSEIKDLNKLLGFDLSGVMAEDPDFFGAGVPGFAYAKLVNTVGVSPTGV